MKVGCENSEIARFNAQALGWNC